MKCNARILNIGKGGQCGLNAINGEYCTKHQNQFKNNNLKFGDIRITGSGSIPLNETLEKKLFGKDNLRFVNISKDRCDEILLGSGFKVLNSNVKIMDRDSATSIITEKLRTFYLTKIFGNIISIAREVYNVLGWGWNESVYREAMMVELRNSNYGCSEEVYRAIPYKNTILSNVCARIDILLTMKHFGMIIELKSDSANKNSMTKAKCQCERYMRIMNYKYGMVINFPEKDNREIEYIVITYFGGKFSNYHI